MADKNDVRFYTDENMPASLAVQFARAGRDIVRCQEVGLIGVSDDVHLAYAAQEGRVVITRDRDFVKLYYQWLSEGRSHAGIIYADKPMSVGSILWILELIAENYSTDEMRDKLVYAKDLMERK